MITLRDLFVAGLTLAGAVAAFEARTHLLLPEQCTVGKTGTRATLSVIGRGSSAVCDQWARTRTYFLRTVPDSGAVLCEFNGSNGLHYTVRDIGVLDVEGGEWCHALAVGQPPRW